MSCHSPSVAVAVEPHLLLWSRDKGAWAPGCAAGTHMHPQCCGGRGNAGPRACCRGCGIHHTRITVAPPPSALDCQCPMDHWRSGWNPPANYFFCCPQLYFRGFVCRWLIQSFSSGATSSFTQVPLSEMHVPAALAAAALFAASHTRFASEVGHAVAAPSPCPQNF